jgi:hypothetical protein
MVAKAANRPPLPATSAAMKSFTRRAVLVAGAGSVMPSTPPMVCDRTAMSMTAASSSAIRPSRRSLSRAETTSANSGLKPA